MGRKHEIVEEDPILKKNHRIEKRRKAKQQEREKQLEQRAKERSRLEELAQVQRAVMQEENELLVREDSTRQQKKGIFLNLSRQNQPERVVRLQHKLKQLVIGEGEPEDRQYYEQHFAEADERIIDTVQASQHIDTNAVVRNQMRQMFGKESLESRIVAEGAASQQRIRSDLKRVENVSIRGTQYCCSRLFEQTASSLKFDSSLPRTVMRSYRDYLHIENKEQQTISEFRKEFVIHILNHLRLCQSATKPSRGFTNPKVLVLTPFMGDARALIEMIVGQVGLPQENAERLNAIEDESDMFRVSINISQRKQKIKFFTNFNHAHIIISSPLGLRQIIGAEGEQGREFSFLSSVEVLIVERAHVILMQNWSHLLEIMDCLNRTPQYECVVNPIQSVRESFLKERGRFYRQNIVFTEFGFPQLNALAKRHFENKEGWLQDVHYYSRLNLSTKLHQEFLKVDVPTIADDLEIRLDFFRRKLWSKLLADELFERCVIFTSSYFEFVKLKAFFEKINAPADFISEHTRKPKVQSRISRFNNREFRFIVMTERAYYFEICQLQRIEHIVFYSLPRNSWIYRRLVESLVQPNPNSSLQLTGSQLRNRTNNIISLCSRYDIQALQRIIGSDEAQEILSAGNKSTSLII